MAIHLGWDTARRNEEVDLYLEQVKNRSAGKWPRALHFLRLLKEMRSPIKIVETSSRNGVYLLS